MSVANLNNGLKVYYQQLGRDYDDIFANYLNENGFEKEDVEEEMNQTDVGECTMLDFDDDGFPLKPAINDEDAQNKEIFRIMKFCYENGAPPSSNSVDAGDINLKAEHVTDNIIQQEIKRYKEQTPGIIQTVSKEPDVMYFLSARSVNNGFPFLQNVVDSYTRDRIIAKYNDKEPPAAEEWVHNNPFTKNLMKKDKKLAKKLAAAIKGYCNRISPLFQFSPLSAVDDSPEDIANYIVSASQFISDLINQKSTKSKVPFQLDLVVHVKNVVSTSTTDIPVSDDDDDDDDDSDDEDDDSDDIKEEVGDLINKLKHEKLGYVDAEIDSTKDIGGLSRSMMQQYNNFRSELKKNGPKPKGKGGHRDFDEESYPQRKRFNIFIDRRQKKDKMVFFEPPTACDTLPETDHVPEWYFESVRKCIIPRKGFGDGSSEEKMENKSDDPTDVTITSQQSVGGQLITFSFHVESMDQIKCYMYWMGQTMRFYPQDIMQAFKVIFEEEKYNKFKNGKKYNKIMNKIKICDKQFEQFYQSLGLDKKKKFPAKQID